MAWLASDLLTDVRRRCKLSSSTALGVADADLLAHADAEMSSEIVPLMLSVSEEFSVFPSDISIVNGQAGYRLPKRNVGGKVRNVSAVIGGAQNPLPRLEPEQILSAVPSLTGQPIGYTVESGTIKLWPTPATTGTLKLPYFVRPGRLTNTASEFKVVTAIAIGATTTLTFGSAHSFAPGDNVDAIAFRPPFEYLIVETPVLSAPSGTTITIANDTPLLAVGDYVCAADKSPVMQCPVELHSLLTELVVRRVMMQIGYRERVAECDKEIERLTARALQVLTPRTVGSARKVIGVAQRMTSRPWGW